MLITKNKVFRIDLRYPVARTLFSNNPIMLACMTDLAHRSDYFFLTIECSLGHVYTPDNMNGSYKLCYLTDDSLPRARVSRSRNAGKKLYCRIEGALNALSEVT